MNPILHPLLVNGPFGDPALYVEFKFAKRALLFDLGDLHALPARKMLRLTDIFVSHLHVDHVIGFDQVLRTLIGRAQLIRLYGPAGFLDAIEHRLAGYAWNLVDRYETDLVFRATEVLSAEKARQAVFSMKKRFRREGERDLSLTDGVILEDGMISARAAILDHGIPCLAFAVQEKLHVNVWKPRLQEMGLPVGPWLRDLKDAVQADAPDDTEIPIYARRAQEDGNTSLALGLLKEKVLSIVPGQKIAYVVDALFSEENARRIVELARDADVLFIEAAFAQEDEERAADRCHLTTGQAGYLAGRAGVRRMEPFHFSPRYQGEEQRLRAEAEAAFAAAATD